jgi:hypothetical protein
MLRRRLDDLRRNAALNTKSLRYSHTLIPSALHLQRTWRGQPVTIAWNVSSERLEFSEAEASRMGMSADEGCVYMIAKRVTELNARVGIDIAFEEEDTPVVVQDGLPRPHLRWILQSEHLVAQNMRRRLARLLSADDTPLTATGHISPEPRAAFESFLLAHPLWVRPGVDDQCTLVFREFPAVLAALVLRLQVSGLCFLHAPLVAVHYLYNLRATAVRASVLDITDFMRRHIGDGGMAKYLFNDGGGDTKSVLLQVLQPAAGATQATLRSCSHDSAPLQMLGPKLRALMRAYGPGVVTSFRAENDLAPPRTSYAGTHTSALNGLHALILVGVRFDTESGKHFMLLQNSWEGLPFFEVDENYWYASEAAVCFVLTPQDAPRAGFATNDLRSAESGVVGAGVAAPPSVR